MTDKYNKLQEKVNAAAKVLEEAQSKLDYFNKEKTISPEEILKEMGRMVSCQDWIETPPANLGTILVRNIFANREVEDQKYKDEYDRDY